MACSEMLNPNSGSNLPLLPSSSCSPLYFSTLFSVSFLIRRKCSELQVLEHNDVSEDNCRGCFQKYLDK